MGEMWCEKRSVLGKRGEDAALEYLLQQGMVLLARNWRSGHKELDLVMDDGRFIRVVEVRSRSVPSVIEPFESITVQKRRKIISAARSFVAQMGLGGDLSGKREVAFDVVSILFNGDLFKIEYIREAFGPVW